MILPKLFIVGAPKCGTTYLHNTLASAQMFVPPVVKEPNFFEYDHNYVRGLSSYTSLFGVGPFSESTVAFESTPYYLYSNLAAHRILKDIGSDCKFVVCIRDPVARAISMYCDLAGSHRERRSFREAFNEDLQNLREYGPTIDGRSTSYLSGGYYSRALHPWLERFGQGRVRIFSLTQITADSRSVAADIASWLELPGAYPSAFQIPHETNSSGALKFRGLESALRWALRTPPGRRLTRRLPWSVYATAADSWRRVVSSTGRTVNVTQDDIEWLYEAASYLYTQELANLIELGAASAVEDWRV